MFNFYKVTPEPLDYLRARLARDELLSLAVAEELVVNVDVPEEGQRNTWELARISLDDVVSTNELLLAIQDPAV